ncbi:MAG: CHAP domain-containing protein [Candidatus Pacebacteria bacterium]|nr:CHAP domain-containing protein [Candidatus Paceibacterota bacterium]
MIPIDIALIEAEAKREDHIEEKTRHYDYESTLCSCVAFARTMRQDIPFINASDMPVSTSSPSVGAVAKLYYPHSMLYHVAIVTDVGEGWIRIDD